jgi:phosphatidate cytidylyltransferase
MKIEKGDLVESMANDGKISSNFWVRLVSSIVLVVLLGITITMGEKVLLATLTLVAMVGYWEFTRATKVNQSETFVNFMQVVGLIGTLGYYYGLFKGSQILSVAMIVFTLVGLMLVYVINFPKYHAKQLMAAFFGFLYPTVMLSFIYLTRNQELGFYIIWLIFLSSWISDTFAYLVGMLFGKHKLAPKLSPKKSIEGSIGGIVASAVLGGVYGYFIGPVIELQNVALTFAIICGIGSVVSQIGDLVASGIKRNYDVKDYGNCIPGHGGIMDRFDSVIFVAPMIYFLSIFFMFYLR